MVGATGIGCKIRPRGWTARSEELVDLHGRLPLVAPRFAGLGCGIRLHSITEFKLCLC